MIQIPIIKALAAASALGVVLGLFGLVDSLRFSDSSEGLRKSGNEGVGEPQNQQAQKGSQTLPNILPQILVIYNINR